MFFYAKLDKQEFIISIPFLLIILSLHLSAVYRSHAIYKLICLVHHEITKNSSIWCQYLGHSLLECRLLLCYQFVTLIKPKIVFSSVPVDI